MFQSCNSLILGNQCYDIKHMWSFLSPTIANLNAFIIPKWVLFFRIHCLMMSLDFRTRSLRYLNYFNNSVICVGVSSFHACEQPFIIACRCFKKKCDAPIFAKNVALLFYISTILDVNISI